MLTSATMGETLTPNPDPNPRGGGQLPNPKSAILC